MGRRPIFSKKKFFLNFKSLRRRTSTKWPPSAAIFEIFPPDGKIFLSGGKIFFHLTEKFKKKFFFLNSKNIFPPDGKIKKKIFFFKIQNGRHFPEGPFFQTKFFFLKFKMAAFGGHFEFQKKNVSLKKW